VKYLDGICETLDTVSHENREKYFFEDMNIDFFEHQLSNEKETYFCCQCM
jgi:hypothetical protein